MIHSRLVFFSILILCSGGLYGQTQQKLNIDAVTVFLSGAELMSSTNFSLAKGENEILFTNVAGDVNSQSITVNATNGVVVESATFQNNYLAAEVLSPHARELKDSIEQIATDTQLVHNKIAVLKHESGTIWKNSQISGSNTGLSVIELSKYLDLVNAKMEGYLNEKDKAEKQLKK